VGRASSVGLERNAREGGSHCSRYLSHYSAFLHSFSFSFMKRIDASFKEIPWTGRIFSWLQSAAAATRRVRDPCPPRPSAALRGPSRPFYSIAPPASDVLILRAARARTF
jgi:hypothetical protein